MISPVPWVVAVDIGIQEVERYPADLNLPDSDVDGGSMCGTRTTRWSPANRAPGDGCRIRVERFVDVLLPPIGVDLLVQVALRA